MATILGVLAVLFWSTVTAVARDAIEKLGPLTTGAAIYLAAGALTCLPLLVRPERVRRILELPRRYLFGCGGLIAAYALCLFLALGLAADRAQAIEVGLINNFWSVLAVLLAIPIQGHRARISLIPGALIACTGIGLVASSQNDLVTWAGFFAGLRTNATPFLLALGAAFCWALYSNLSRRWSASAGGSAMGIFLSASGLALLVARCFFHEHSQWSPRTVAEVAFYAVVPLSLAYLCWDIAMRRGRMVFIVSFSCLLPLFSTVVSSLYLRVSLKGMLWIGCAVLIAGAIICKRSVIERTDEGPPGAGRTTAPAPSVLGNSPR
jgi:drug/metabolite transporter (DMT)-like permease